MKGVVVWGLSVLFLAFGVLGQDADIAVEISGPELVSDGDLVTYTITVTNGGPDTVDVGLDISWWDTEVLSGVSYEVTYDGSWDVTEESFEWGYLSFIFYDMDPDASATVTLTGTFSSQGEGVTCLTVDGYGWPEEEADDPDWSNNEASSATADGVDLAIEKYALVEGEVMLGDVVEYEIHVWAESCGWGPAAYLRRSFAGFAVAANEGGGPSARNVTIVDTDVLNCLEEPTFELEVYDWETGETSTDFGNWTGSYTIEELGPSQEVRLVISGNIKCCGEVMNTASVSSQTPDPVGYNNSSSATVTVLCPELSLTKEADREEAALGETITYTITVSNTGDIDFDEVSVEDPLLGISQTFPLSRGETRELQGTYTVTREDLCAGEVENTVRAVAYYGEAGQIEREATETVAITYGASLEVRKEADREEATVGDVIIYTIAVANTGDVTLHGVVVEDDLLGIVGEVEELPPGASETFTATYTVAEGDVCAGVLVDTATARAEDPCGNEVTASATEEIPLVYDASMAVEVEAWPLEATVGDVIQVDVEVTNTGNVALTDVVLKLCYFQDVEIGELQAGESFSHTFDFAITSELFPCHAVMYAVSLPKPPSGCQACPPLVPHFPEFHLAHCHTLPIVVRAEGLDPCGKCVTGAPEADPVVELHHRGELGIDIRPVTEFDTKPKAGDVITYEITVENPGNIPLCDISVTSEKLGFEETIDSLAPGDERTFAVDYTVTEADVAVPFYEITVEAEAEGIGNCGETTFTARDRAIIPWANDPPQAQDLFTSTELNTPVKIEIRGWDIDIPLPPYDPTLHALTFEIIDPPENGTVSGDLAAVSYEGKTAKVPLLYTPEPGFVGKDRFDFRVVDPYGEDDIGTVIVDVLPKPAEYVGEKVPPVSIAEIAWGGTAADPNHEWIELANNTPEAIDLSGWVLRWRRKDPPGPWITVQLKGEIPPLGRFLLERGTDEVISDVKADLVYPEDIELPDEGAYVELIDHLGEVVDTANSQGTSWAAGEGYRSMERIDPLAPDRPDNWSTNAGVVARGLDLAGDWIMGTPGMANEPVLVEALNGEPVPVAAGRPFVLVLPLLKDVPHRTVLVRAIPGEPISAWPKLEGHIRGEVEPEALVLTVDTTGLREGTYQVWVAAEGGYIYGASFEVVRP